MSGSGKVRVSPSDTYNRVQNRIILPGPSRRRPEQQRRRCDAKLLLETEPGTVAGLCRQRSPVEVLEGIQSFKQSIVDRWTPGKTHGPCEVRVRLDKGREILAPKANGHAEAPAPPEPLSR